MLLNLVIIFMIFNISYIAQKKCEINFERYNFIKDESNYLYFI